jgi:hypothetical protein
MCYIVCRALLKKDQALWCLSQCISSARWSFTYPKNQNPQQICSTYSTTIEQRTLTTPRQPINYAVNPLQNAFNDCSDSDSSVTNAGP